jgi:hypothetical protein
LPYVSRHHYNLENDNSNIGVNMARAQFNECTTFRNTAFV